MLADVYGPTEAEYGVTAHLFVLGFGEATTVEASARCGEERIPCVLTRVFGGAYDLRIDLPEHWIGGVDVDVSDGVAVATTSILVCRSFEEYEDCEGDDEDDFEDEETEESDADR